MRALSLAVVALCLAGCAGSSAVAPQTTSGTSSPSATGPPKVTEAFTPLPRNPNTTVGMEGCAEHRILRTDAIVNRRVQLIWDKSTADGQSHLADAQAAWAAYRKAACLSESDKYAGGSLAPVVAGQCSLRLTRERAADLGRQLRPLRSA